MPTELPRGRLCVCVPLGNGWFLQVTNFRIVVVEQRGLRAGRLHGCWAGSEICCCKGTGFALFTCLQG